VSKDILKYEDFLMEDYFRFIDTLSINESIENDVASYLRTVLQKIKNLTIEKKKTVLIYALSSLLAFSNSDKILSVINTDNFIKSELDSFPELKDIVEEKLEKSLFQDATKMRLSQNGWNEIKIEEGDPKKPGDPVLKAYELGDGKITLGWGHAEPISTSKYKNGQIITREEAQKLLQEDLTKAADGVRRIFKEWEKNGEKREVTQDQFDALVSLAFNLGVSGLRRSDVIQHIKKGDYKAAGESIKKQSISKKFPGLKIRRERESDLFLSYLSAETASKNI